MKAKSEQKSNTEPVKQPTESPDTTHREQPSAYVPFSFGEPSTPWVAPPRARFEAFPDTQLTANVAQMCDEELLRTGFALIAEAMARKQPNRPRAAATLALAGWVLEGMRALECLASEGDHLAADFLVRIAKDAARDLNSMVCYDAKPFIGPARKELTWPVLYSPQKDLRTDTHALGEKLKIGADFEINLFGKARSLDLNAGGNKLALAVFDTLRKNQVDLLTHPHNPSAEAEEVPGWVSECRSLKPFNNKTVKQWIDVGWGMILHYTNGKPEEHNHLKKLGNHRKGKGHEGSNSEGAHVRNGIKEEFSEAMRKLAEPKPAD